MLIELSVRDLGVVEELRLELSAGLTAFTGETGAGKTLIVEAIGLLMGGRAEGIRVREGAAEAVVEGRFDDEGDEVVLRRVVPKSGRSRGYVNGDMATVATLAEWGNRLVDLHAQHGHQTLLGTAAQRRALDHTAGIDLTELHELRRRIATVTRELESLGGDAATRDREVELVRFQLDELEAAALIDPDEDGRLSAEEDALADVVGNRAGAAEAMAAVTEDGGAVDALGIATGALRGRTPFDGQRQRLEALLEELSDVGRELRTVRDQIVDNPARLDELRERRQLLHTLARKYGDGTHEGVFVARDHLVARLDELEHSATRAAELTEEKTTLVDAESRAAIRVGDARRSAAPVLGAAVQRELRKLALVHASLTVEVGDGAGEDVCFLLAANPGTQPLPLARVASGGELARTMLALRLVLPSLPPTVVFDEVDAGIGGEAAIAVGAALARVGSERQVLVVTHLAQVAAAATSHVGVSKVQSKSATSTSARVLDGEERVIELSRMLSGQPDSTVAQAHARELLAGAHPGGPRD